MINVLMYLHQQLLNIQNTMRSFHSGDACSLQPATRKTRATEGVFFMQILRADYKQYTYTANPVDSLDTSTIRARHISSARAKLVEISFRDFSPCSFLFQKFVVVETKLTAFRFPWNPFHCSTLRQTRCVIHVNTPRRKDLSPRVYSRARSRRVQGARVLFRKNIITDERV